MQRYNPKEIEPKWQAQWAKDKIYEADVKSSKKKFIGFGMFNYPSGAGIHIGHGKNFTLPDIVVRAKRQQGFEAYMPVGWDSFGLPAENYAIKTGTSPRVATDKAIENYRKQYKAMGWSMDWSKEIDSSSPEYYRWTQWIFTKLFEKGLAYQKENLQWWCPVDLTVLANEQVEAGKCWRCGNEVVKKNLKQWFFKITDYADEILEATDDLNWTESVKTMQKNWIGRSIGAEVDFKVDGSEGIIKVFTTRIDTIFGATFLVLAPEHELVSVLTTDQNKDRVENYVQESVKKSEIERMDASREKTGVFTGSFAVNPATSEKIPIWVADYVLAGYGTGAIMAVPAHDERDLEFADKFNLPVVQVVAERFIDANTPHQENKETVERDVVVVIVKHPSEDRYIIVCPKGSEAWSPLMGGVDEGELTEEAAKRELLEETGYHDIKSIRSFDEIYTSEFFAQHKDVNRIAYCKVVRIDLASLDINESAAVDINEQDYKWVTKEEYMSVRDSGGMNECFEIAHGINRDMALEGRLINSREFSGLLTSEAREKMTKAFGKEKVNYKLRDWLISRQRYWGAPIPIIHCPEHGAVSVPEDRLPVVLPEIENYAPTGGETSVLAGVDEWVNVDCPKCGKPAKRETDTMDGYACSSWYFLRYIDPNNEQMAWDPEIAQEWMPVDFYNGGDHATAHLLYARFFMRFFHKLGLTNTPEPFNKMYYHAKILAPDGSAFSKSKGNGVDPLQIIESGYGADALRTYIMFIAPPDMESPWSNEGVPGCYRFLNRLWTITHEFLESSETKASEEAKEALARAINPSIKKVTEDIEAIKFNTAIAAMMECVNELYRIKAKYGFVAKDQWQTTLESLVQIVAPFAPHIAEELWHELGHKDSVHVNHWPEWNDNFLTSKIIKLAVQINGKVRAEIEVDADTPKEQIIVLAKQQSKIAEIISSKEIKKEIYVPGRIVSLVVI